MNNKDRRKPLIYKPRTVKLAMKELRSTKFYAVILISVILTGVFNISPVISLLMSNVTISSSGTIAIISPLHVKGRYIMDDQNNTVILRGVDVGDFQDTPGGMWQGNWLTTYQDWQSNQALVTAELNEIKSWGCNCVRSLYRAQFWVNNTQNFRQIIQQYASLLAQRNMYLILEGWTVTDNGSSPQDPLPYPPYQTSTGAANIIPDEAAYENMMLSIATTLKAYPNVIIGLWNEPQGDATAEASWLNAVQTTINMIRSAGVDNIILVQWGGTWCNLAYPQYPPQTIDGYGASLEWILNYPLSGSNIVYQAHIYYDSIQYPSGVGGGVGYGGLNYTQVMQGLNMMWIPYVINNLSKPLLIGESGCNVWWTGSNLADALKSYDNLLTAFNNLGIGYCAWVFRISMMHSLISSYSPSWTPTGAGSILKNAIAATPSILPPA